MAKTCWLERKKRKQKTVEKYAKLRAELKAKKDYIGLSMLPRDASPTRLVNRCKVTGRRRAFYPPLPDVTHDLPRTRLHGPHSRRDQVQLVAVDW